MELIPLLIGLALGLAVAALFLKKRISDATRIISSQSEIELALSNERLNAATEENSRMRAERGAIELQSEGLRQQLEAALRESAQFAERASRVPLLEQELTLARASAAEQHDSISLLRQELGLSRANLAAERSQYEEKLKLLTEARQQLSDQFKSLANEILEEKARRFTEQNQTNIGQLLEPLKLKLTEFQGKVEEVYVQEGKERSALAAQVKHLMDLNRQLSDDAHSLTRALKGSSKSQGNWGEMILERILESSGLRRGHEYVVQESHGRDDGSRAQPDVIIHLPEERHIVIDAKVSLTAYEEHVNAEDDVTARDLALKRHLDSVRGHIKGLSEKNYHDIHGVRSLDFVLLFIPVEPAFMLAIAHDSELWQDAWKRNILLVSPSTLLFVVRTVAHLWRQEQQNRNAQEIARRGAELYDKLVGFVEDLKGVGNRLEQARSEYDRAFGKFVGGRGNVIRQAEMLKGLGVKPGKNLPVDLLDISTEDQDLLSPIQEKVVD